MHWGISDESPKIERKQWHDDKLTSQQLDKSRRIQTDKVDQSTLSKMHNTEIAQSTRNQTNDRTDRDSRMSQRAVTKSTDARKSTNTTKKRAKSVEGKEGKKKIKQNVIACETTKLQKDKKKL